MQAEQLDASGSVKEAVEGDVGVLQGSGSLPAGTAAGGAGPSAAATAGPAGGAAAAAAPTPATGASNEEVAKLQSVTGMSAQECMQALEACNGNADAAAAMLLGL